MSLKIRIPIAIDPSTGEWVAYRTSGENLYESAQTALETLQEIVPNPDQSTPVLHWVEIDL